MSKLFFGVEKKYIDITNLSIHFASNTEDIVIPHLDSDRVELYGDPAIGEEKHILLKQENGEKKYFLHKDICTIEKNKLDTRIFKQLLSNITVFIIAFNQLTYIREIVEQLRSFTKNIVIVDNASTYPPLLSYYNSLFADPQVSIVRRNQNNGHYVVIYHLYTYLPQVFAMTDPDLLLNQKMPRNALDVMHQMGEQFQAEKVGVALNICSSLLFRNLFFENKSIREWEEQYWKKPITHSTLTLFDADVDTTLTVVNKKFRGNQKCIRIAGDYIAIHRPWLIDNGLSESEENYYITHKSSMSGTWMKEDKKNCVLMQKRLVSFFVNELSSQLQWWKNHFSNWETHTFQIFDFYLTQDSVYIDVGAWIGTTVLYAATKAKKIFAIEPDPVALVNLRLNIEVNAQFEKIIEVIPQALDSVDGKTLFGGNGELGNSMSTLIVRDASFDSQKCGPTSIITVDTISMNSLENKFPQIKESKFAKVDIEGGEKYVVPAILPFLQKYQIPLLISLHWCFLSESDVCAVISLLYTSFPFIYSHYGDWQQWSKDDVIRWKKPDLLCSFEQIDVKKLI